MNIQSLITSSADAEKVSLFVKSLVTFFLLVGFDSAVVNEGGGYLSNLIVGLSMIASAVTGFYGLSRKIRLGRWHA